MEIAIQRDVSFSLTSLPLPLSFKLTGDSSFLIIYRTERREKTDVMLVTYINLMVGGKDITEDKANLKSLTFVIYFILTLIFIDQVLSKMLLPLTLSNN